MRVKDEAVRAQRRRMTDRIMLACALAMFLCVVAYILWKRVRHIAQFIGQ